MLVEFKASLQEEPIIVDINDLEWVATFPDLGNEDVAFIKVKQHNDYIGVEGHYAEIAVRFFGMSAISARRCIEVGKNLGNYNRWVIPKGNIAFIYPKSFSTSSLEDCKYVIVCKSGKIIEVDGFTACCDTCYPEG